MTQLWVKCFFVFLLALIARSLNADELVATPSGRARSYTPVISESIPAYSPYRYRISVGGGMSAAENNGGWAIPVTILTQFGYGLYWGLDTGVNFWDFKTGQGTAARVIGVPLLATLVWEGDVRGPVRYHPTIGVGVGPHFLNNPQGMTTYAQLMVKAGVNFEIARDFLLGIENRLGLLGSTFTLIPQLTGALKF